MYGWNGSVIGYHLTYPLKPLVSDQTSSLHFRAHTTKQNRNCKYRTLIWCKVLMHIDFIIFTLINK